MRIRWNSTYKMISRLIKYQSILDMLMNQLALIKGVSAKHKDKLLKFQISDQEWEILTTLNSALDIFSDTSDMLAGNQYSSFAAAHPAICSLEFYLQSASASDIEQSIKDP